LRHLHSNGTINLYFVSDGGVGSFCVERWSKGIKLCKAAGFNNPAGRALTGAVDLLEPADAFNISVPGTMHVAGLKAE
jgi:hypothetical protein